MAEPLHTRLLIENLSQPVQVTTAPGDPDRLYVVEQAGRVLAWDRRTGTSSVFLDVVDKVVSGGEAGLLGVAFHPRYAENGRYFVNYTARNPRFGNTIAEYGREGNAERTLMKVEKPYTNHNGGQLAFGPDGTLYISTGDGGSGGDPFGHSQNRGSLLGKILRIDVNRGEPYAVPKDNPFATGGGRGEIFALGLRNVWRFSFDRTTGQLFGGDVGQDRLEEIDVIRRGGNYGWNVTEGNLCFKPAQGCDKTGLIAPIHEYRRTDGISVTGGFVYRGAALPELRGQYVFGDFQTGKVWALEYDFDSGLAGRRTLILDSGLNVSAFGETEAGELLVVHYGGEIYELVR